MKRLTFSIAAIASLGLVSCGNSPSETATKADSSVSDVSNARLIAALSYADWCGSCKTIDPKIQEARASGDLGAAFVTLDYTAKDNDAYFAAADKAGIGGPVREKYAEAIKTGHLLLIDVDDAEIVGVVTKDMSPAEIASAVEDAAAGA